MSAQAHAGGGFAPGEDDPVPAAQQRRLRNSRPAKRARLLRARLNLYPRLRLAYKIVVGVFGVAVVIAGVILIPLPGPGWLVVFLGLAILGTEFPAAHRLNMWVQGKVRAVVAWFRERRARRARERAAARESARRAS